MAALAVAAPSAHGAAVKTLPCVPYIAGQQTMPIAAGGFTPGSFVSLSTNTAASQTPVPLTSKQADAAGALTAAASPPFSVSGPPIQSFNLIAADATNPAAPVVATSPFQVVRFGITRTPNPKRPRQTVTYKARGFLQIGKPIYAHFRYGGVTRRTVSLGIAKGTCGTSSRRMRALPTKVRYGNWKAYIDQKKTFSVSTRPQWIDPFRISRVVVPR